jgi:hypothetical protein
MKKLTLKLEELSVVSFTMEKAEKERGTVDAHYGVETEFWKDTCHKCDGGSLSFCFPCAETEQDTCTQP